MTCKTCGSRDVPTFAGRCEPCAAAHTRAVLRDRLGPPLTDYQNDAWWFVDGVLLIHDTDMPDGSTFEILHFANSDAEPRVLTVLHDATRIIAFCYGFRAAL